MVMSHVVNFFLFFLKELKGIAMQFKKLQRYDRVDMKTKTVKKNESLALLRYLSFLLIKETCM